MEKKFFKKEIRNDIIWIVLFTMFLLMGIKADDNFMIITNSMVIGFNLFKLMLDAIIYKIAKKEEEEA